MRYAGLLLIGVLFVQLGIPTADVGIYESLVFLSSFLSFFWLSGITQGLLALHKDEDESSGLFLSTFMVLGVMSVLAGVVFKLLITPFSIMSNNPDILYFGGPIFWFILLNGPASMAEYVLLLKKRSKLLGVYALVAYPIQVALVVSPILLGSGLEGALNGMVYSAGFRFMVAFILTISFGGLKVQLPVVKQLLLLSWPLILGTLLSGSAEYIDGVIVSRFFDEGTFAIYRYGAKEMPLFILMAAAFSNAQVNLIAQSDELKKAAEAVKKGSLEMLKWFFPIAILLTVLSPWLFTTVFNAEFGESALIFNAYLLTLASRMTFPQTLLIGRGFTKAVLNVGIIEILVNVGLSLILVQAVGLVGIAYASVVAYSVEKVLLTVRTKNQLNLNPTEFIAVKPLLLWTGLLVVVHVVVAVVL